MSVKGALDTFGHNLVTQSKRNLRAVGKGGGSLEKSISAKAIQFPNSFQFSFLMEDYGEYVDAGVKGIGGTKADGSKWKLKTVTNNKFKYNQPSKTSSGGRFKQSLGGWSIRKGIAPRSKGGQFTKRKGLVFALRKHIIHTGIETTNFFTTPFDKLFKTFPDEVVEAYGLEVDTFLKASLNN